MSIVSLLALSAATAHAAEEESEKKMRARPTERPITVDGRLDEPEWALAEPATDFLQSEPHEGKLATDRTEVRVLFDKDNLYFGVYCYQATDKIVVTELKRDFTSDQSDSLGIVLDPLHDHRNGFVFFVNPGSAMEDVQTGGDGREMNRNWDAVWHASAKVVEDGWTVEVAIPFKSLGFTSKTDRVIGINFKRKVRHKNESSYWNLVPRRFRLNRVSLAGVLLGLQEVRTGHNFRVKPFVTSSLAQRRDEVGSRESFDVESGVDLKYKVNQGLTLDLTYNTDFSQVEVDTQQINLTRFGLFFPEKRDFFLENASFFDFGDVPSERNPRSRSEDTQLFYSRRIGLSAAGGPLPLLGGVRLSGRAGPFALGMLNIQQEESGAFSSNNFTVTRVRRNVFRQSDIGAIFVNRQGGGSHDYSRAYGVDANLLFSQRFTIHSFLAGTQSPGIEGRNLQTKVSSKWDNGFWYMQTLFADIGENFRPEVGFVPRAGVRNYQFNIGFKPRTRGNGYIREFHPHTNTKYFTDRDNRVLTKEGHHGFEVFFRDGGKVEVAFNPHFERLRAPFRIAPRVTIPIGDYYFNDYYLEYNSDRSRLLSGAARMTLGSFYDGDRTSAVFSATLSVKPHLLADVSYERNTVDVKAGKFQADLYGWRFRYSFNPRMFVDAFVQYNTSTGKVLTNVRFNLEHRPLSHISVVWTEDRGVRLDEDLARALIVKYTHLLQF
ncbi:MAG: carbohydrate binding family 9 domain-containing protein [Acidobacteria bacterium]|nr:carbohydrate binding family 9 domain-containing protein [Acidobacteriota bacterium]